MIEVLPPTPVQRLLRPFKRFIEAEATSGVLLISCAALALWMANSPWAAAYDAFWHTKLSVEIGPYKLANTLAHWINDGLMAVFFLLVGLEIKREMLSGELASPRRAALPIAAALGGMLVPALIYTMLNREGVASRGWGIPMATDIAFAIGVLALLGPRAPLGLKVFLAAVAIVDDLGAVAVIALFYTSEISWEALIVAGGLVALLAALNLLGLRRTSVFAALGILLWLAFLKSGVHATIAGVLLAICVPDRRRIDSQAFVKLAHRLVDEFDRYNDKLDAGSLSSDQADTVMAINYATEAVQSPLRRLEHALLPWVAYFIMPVFALANGGVSLAANGGFGSLASSPITWGVLLGLVLGKPIGVFGFSWLAIRLELAQLPRGVGWSGLFGVSLLCGIGFTMALFIAELALGGTSRLDEAKLGIMVASLIASVAGSLCILMSASAHNAAEQKEELSLSGADAQSAGASA